MSKRPNYIAAVDPGLQGAICVIESPSGKLASKFTFDKDSSGKIDWIKMRELVEKINDVYSPTWVVEKLQPIFGISKSSAWSLADNWGTIKGILIGLYCPDFILVTPKDWQKKVHIPTDVVLKKGKKTKDPKLTSLKSAERLYPRESFLYGDNEKQSGRRTKPNLGIVDALLIAHANL